MKYYLDTNTIIYAVKGVYPELKERFRRVNAQSIVIPYIVAAEIEYGARKSHDYEKTMALYKRFLEVFPRESFSDKAAAEYGRIRAKLESVGTPIDPNDLIIAAIVSANDGILVTDNEKEFSRLEGLKIENWTN